MTDHIYIIALEGERVPHFVYAENEQQALNIALSKKKEAEIMGKLEVKEYMKNEKSYQEIFTKKLERKQK